MTLTKTAAGWLIVASAALLSACSSANPTAAANNAWTATHQDFDARFTDQSNNHLDFKVSITLSTPKSSPSSSTPGRTTISLPVTANLTAANRSGHDVDVQDAGIDYAIVWAIYPPDSPMCAGRKVQGQHNDADGPQAVGNSVRQQTWCETQIVTGFTNESRLADQQTATYSTHQNEDGSGPDVLAADEPPATANSIFRLLPDTPVGFILITGKPDPKVRPGNPKVAWVSSTEGIMRDVCA